jgi:hypothetical protein
MGITKTKVINPLQFILGNVLKNNLIMIKLKEEAIPDDTPLKDCMDYYNSTIPAGTSYLLFTQIEANLIECPTSSFGTQDMEAFYVSEGEESDTDPIPSERIVASGKLF